VGGLTTEWRVLALLIRLAEGRFKRRLLAGHSTRLGVQGSSEGARRFVAPNSQRITEPVTLGVPLGIAQRTAGEAWKADALPTELLPRRELMLAEGVFTP
jgi:hypothetical protein